MQNIKDMGAEGGDEICCEERKTGSNVIEISVQSGKKNTWSFYPVKCPKNVCHSQVRLLRTIRDQVSNQLNISEYLV